MYNSQYYSCEQIDQRLLQGYLDDYNTQNNTNLTKAEFLTLLFNTVGRNNTIDNLAIQIGYYECDTAAGTAAKAITVANYAMFAGGSMKVKFVNKNTANNATLNINSQGAKALYYQGERASSTNSWDEGEVVEIYYDGTSYYANNVKGGSGSGVYDVSKEHPTLGPNSDGKFTLEYILSNVNELIHVNKRQPGMSIQFVSTYDNKYVQYRYMGTSTAVADFTNEANWELDVTKKNLSEDFLGLLSEIKDFTIKDYSIGANGKFGSSTNYKHAVLSVNEGEVYYLIGQLPTCRAAFVTTDESSSGADVPVVSGTGIMLMGSAEQYYKFIIPQGCTHLIFNASGDYGTRCYKHYDSLKEGTDKYTDGKPTAGSTNLTESGGIFADIRSIPEYNLISYTTLWGYKFTRLNPTIVAESWYQTEYTKVTKDDTIKLSLVAKDSGSYIYVGFVNAVPEIGSVVTDTVTWTISDITTGDFLIKVPYDGYIVICYTANIALDLYKISRNDFITKYTPYPISIGSVSTGKCIEAYEISQNFGNAVGGIIESWGVSDYIDISEYSYLYTRGRRATVRTVARDNNAGTVFYNSEKQPIGVASRIGYSYVSAKSFLELVEVPEGAVYVRGTYYVSSANTDVQLIGLKLDNKYVSPKSSNFTEDEKTAILKNIGAKDRIENKLFSFVGFGTTGSEAGVTKVGDIYRNTDSSKFRRAIAVSGTSFTYEDVPDDLNSLYICKGTLYKFYENSDNELILTTLISDDPFIHVINGRDGNLVSTHRTYSDSPKMKLSVGVKYRMLINYPDNNDTGNAYALSLYKVTLDPETGSEVSTRVVGWSSSQWYARENKSYYDFVAEENEYYYIGARSRRGTAVVVQFIRYDAINNDDIIAKDAETIKSRTIFELNPDTEMYQKMIIAKKRYYASEQTDVVPLVLAHISDIHGQNSQYARYVQFANHWKNKGYVDELIDTGDVVQSYYSDALAWRENITGVENILTVVGNHDTRANDEEASDASLSGFNRWNYHSHVSIDPTKRNDVYNMLMVGPDSENPYIDNWGVTQPIGAEEDGLCYYYKDYTDNNRSIRLIGIDVMGYDADQHTWLQNLLADAITNNLHVVILTHFTATVMDRVECNYSSLRLSGSSFDGSYSVYLEQTDRNALPEAVDAFQSAGGNFIGYIIGHYHRDMINTVQNYPKQLIFAVSSGGKTPIRDFTKVSGSKSYDDFQIVSINTYDRTVKLIKVGADIDYYMRKKGTICVGYTLVKDDGTEPAAGETATKVKGVIGEGW